MKNRLLFLLFIFSVYIHSSHASEYFILSSTYLYASPQENSEQLGVFARGGHFEKIESVDDVWWKIKAENGLTGYVKTEYTASHLNAADYYEPDPDIFIQNDGYMGCPHLFVRASSLKARKEPHPSAKVDRVLFINTAFCIGFIPYDENGWVNIGGFSKESRAYIQRKYLGERYQLEEVIQTYLNLDKQDIANRKLWIERLAEISWLEKPADRVKALDLCYTFWKEQKDVQRTNQTEFDLFRAKAMQNPLPLENMENYFKPGDTYMMLNNKKVQWSFSLPEVNELNLPYDKKTDMGDENMCDEAHYQLLFKTFILNVYQFEDNPARVSVHAIDLSVNGNAFILNKFKIDKNTTEKDFITNFGQVINVHYTEPHTYYINLSDASFITIVFKNGKALSFKETFYC